jgi:hypothetical protein
MPLRKNGLSDNERRAVSSRVAAPLELTSPNLLDLPNAHAVIRTQHYSTLDDSSATGRAVLTISGKYNAATGGGVN